MFKGFNLSIEDISKFENNGYYTNLLDKKKRQIELTIENIMLNNGCIDAVKIIEEWFPTDDYHVFISHSHKDIDKAKALANWLYEKFNIKSFVDSHVWGYANDLLYKINDLYARKDSDTFQYEPAVSYAANVHLMLSTALNEVMDKSECLFFINSSNAINSIELNDGNHDLRTSSAWIMHELKSSAIMRRELSANRPKAISESAGLEKFKDRKEFYHLAPTEHLIDITEDMLTAWYELCYLPHITLPYSVEIEQEIKKEFDALDRLYQITDL